MNRMQIADLILSKLEEKANEAKLQFNESRNKIGFFFIDELLPKSLAENLFSVFPSKEQMIQKKDIREYKYVGVQMNQYEPLLEECLYAFQDKRVVNLVGQICGLKNLQPDQNLYAGGVSRMEQNNFLNPHLDNSHDKNRNRWRILNLLYYVSPEWEEKLGGNLEIWPNGLNSKPITIDSKFNRLTIMVTHGTSWHSVNKVEGNFARCCISNYYFSQSPYLASDKFHVTTFRNPKDKLSNALLTIDSRIRSGLRKIFKLGFFKTKHVYSVEEISKRPERSEGAKKL